MYMYMQFEQTGAFSFFLGGGGGRWSVAIAVAFKFQLFVCLLFLHFRHHFRFQLKQKGQSAHCKKHLKDYTVASNWVCKRAETAVFEPDSTYNICSVQLKVFPKFHSLESVYFLEQTLDYFVVTFWIVKNVQSYHMSERTQTLNINFNFSLSLVTVRL